MIMVLEPTLRGSGHSSLNAGILTTLLRAWPAGRLAFFAEPAHLDCVRALLLPEDAERIEFSPLNCRVPMMVGQTRAQVRRSLTEQLAPRLRAAQAAYLLTTSIHGPMVQVVRGVADRLSRTGPVHTQFSLHGTNRGSFLYRSRNPLVRWWELPAAVPRFDADQVRYLVLDEATTPGWTALCPALATRLGTLEIALSRAEAEVVALRREPGHPLRFGLLGQATAAKGFFAFRDLAARYGSQVPAVAEFHLVGRIGSELAGESLDHLVLPWPQVQVRGQAPAQMSREDYIAGVAALDYACLLYAGDYYESGASGVFFDAVNFARPLIARPTRFIAQAFARFGDIGFDCRSDEEVSALVAGILAGNHTARYAAQVQALVAAREWWFPEAVAVRFRGWLAGVAPTLARSLELGA